MEPVPSTVKNNMSLNPQITGNLGLYYCCYKLRCLAGT